MTRQEQVDLNYQSFLKALPDLIAEHGGKFALMSDGEIIDFYETVGDAYLAGSKIYGDGKFSIQEINGVPVNLGYFSYAFLHKKNAQDLRQGH